MKVNYLAVLVSAIAFFILGFLWYGLLFAKPWMALEGITPGTMPKNVATEYLISFVAQIFLCYALALICHWRSANLAKGTLLGIFMWAAFVLTTTLTAQLFEGRSLELWAINYGYDLAGMAIAGAILGGWRKKTI
jgi:Protein of unknown function (DUF1761)